MELVEVDPFTVHGLTLRTCSSQETDPNHSAIRQHVALVDANVQIDYRSGARAYSVYSNYQAKDSGYFNVLMGSTLIASAKLPLDSVHISGGQYLRFSATGAFPETIINTWQTIWDYFKSPQCCYQRAFTTDFEFYQSANSVQIFIALT